jgi:ubiquinone/menaquinone biosynthesis C-methylase UbiE
LTKNSNTYIPALNQRWLTGLYDPLQKWIMNEDLFRDFLVSSIHPAPGEKILDIGCGTGTLTILAKERFPLAEINGLDGDPAVIQIAVSKAYQRQVDIKWIEGMAFNLPLPDHSFDHVVSSLMVHHLSLQNKLLTFKEVRRVLKPQGQFLLLDFGLPTSLDMRLVSLVTAHLEKAGDNIRGMLPDLLKEVGFRDLQELRHFKSIFGELICYETRSK